MSTTTVKNKRAANRTTNGRQAAQKPDAKPNGKTAAMPQSAAAPSPFTPIAEYGFLSDCHTAALIAPDGTIDWLCVPRFDSPSVFGALLDRGAGAFRLGPFGINVPSGRTYEPGTNTLITSWKTPSGWATTREALTMGPRRGEDTVTPHTRPPADEDAEHTLVRSITCVEGTVEIELVCDPAFDYGRTPGEWSLSSDRHRAEVTGAGQKMTLQTDMLLGIEANHVRGRHVLPEGEELYCALSWDDAITPPANVEEANARLNATSKFWRHWLARARIPDHELRPLIQRSALAIKGLTYMPTGATVAALTTSLPETPGGERNWDYRFTWIRDSTFTLQALHFLELDWEANEFMQFIADLERDEDGALQIMYGIDGRRDLTEILFERALGLRRRAPGPDRQRRFRSAPERRVRRRARFRASAYPAQPAAPAAPVAADPVAGGVRQSGLAPPRPGHLGGPRQAAALRVLKADVLGGDGPGGEARRDPR